MALDSSFTTTGLAAAVWLGLSLLIERLLLPTPRFFRPFAAWLVHSGVSLLLYGLYVILLGRPWFSLSAICLLLLIIVLVSNAKFRALREPFVFQDYEYFVDAIRHPRLYLPFFGWRKIVLSLLVFLAAVYAGFEIEPPTTHRFELNGQSGAVLGMWFLAFLVLLIAKRTHFTISTNPVDDLSRLGLITCLWAYGWRSSEKPAVRSPFSDVIGKDRGCGRSLPNLVAVQSESFFDPRRLYTGIRSDILCEFDRLRSESVACGRLKVPAWGANTVRTEFAFLSGIGSEQLGTQRFNPYRAIAQGWDVPNVLTFAKQLGYRTVCIHPYPSSFYQRKTVFEKWGVDEFIDIRSFDDQDRFGPYVGDLAVARMILSVIEQTSQPVFVFTITMENHGPLHLETIRPEELPLLYDKAPPPGCDDLSIYLRHLRNADAMIGFLRNKLAACPQETSLCWYGDHVPIMPRVYDALGLPSGDVEYVLWHSRPTTGEPFNCRVENALEAHALSPLWFFSSVPG